MRFGCWAAFALSDDDAVRTLAGESADVSRDRGELQVLAEALNYLGWCELRVGSLIAADVYFTESNGIEAFLRRSGLAEANKLIAQAHAEVRRAAAVALEQEMVARVQEMRARVVEAEAQIPMAMAEAFRQGNLGVMDYYKLKNVQADTSMRESIAGGGNAPSGPKQPGT